MDYLLDTNLILFYLRNETKVIDIVDTLYRLFATPNSALISIVSIAELKSLAMRNDWGYHRLSHMQLFLNELLRVDINSEDVFERYAEIDTFSQGKSKIKSLKDSARNMGKNDLWIAATASVLNIPLLTTDKDFNHLKDVYVDVRYIALTGAK
jgi:tRNA(fMet)-specific endonuclease VapC